MKLLFDQNLSHRLVGLMADLFPRSSHVRLLNTRAASLDFNLDMPIQSDIVFEDESGKK